MKKLRMRDPQLNPTRDTHEENVLDQSSQHAGDRDYEETHPAAQTLPPVAAAQPVPQEHSHGSSAPQVKVDTTSRIGRGPLMLVGLLGLVLAIFIAFGLYRRASAESGLKTEAATAAVASVAVTHPVGGAIAQEVRLPADTQAYTDTAIYCRTNGYLQKWYADIGANVRKGQLLAVVETPEVDQQVQQAQADVVTAKANKQLADTTNDRWKALLAKNAVSKQEADQTASDLLVKESALNAAEANFRRLQQMQSFEHIYAPFDGVITARNVDVGSLIQAGDSNTPHSELFHLNSVGTLRLYVPVPEIYVRAIHDGEKVKVTSDAFPGEIFIGTVVRNATSIDTMSRTLKVEVDVQNSEHRLLPGQYAFVNLPIPSSASSMTLPSNTVLFRAEGLRVGVVRDGRVHLAPIAIGHDYGATVEVISGVRPSDSVILNPSDSLAEGAPVRVEGHQ